MANPTDPTDPAGSAQLETMIEAMKKQHNDGTGTPPPEVPPPAGGDTPQPKGA